MLKRLSFVDRVAFCKNTQAKTLFTLMHEKKTNLALSADVTSTHALLALAKELGPEICILKTHVDVLEDFSLDFIHSLKKLAKQYKFILFEDRKFADIGYTVTKQYGGGIYRIADWAPIVNAHALPGPGIVLSLAKVGLDKGHGLLLLASMSSKDNLCDPGYAEKTLKIAEQFPEFVMGFIAQQRLSTDPKWIYMTPGVQFSQGGDQLGQQYILPRTAIIEQGSDIIIVGRGILEAENPLKMAQEYRKEAWAAYAETALI